MQFIDILTNAIVLFAAAYFLIALTVHLHHCWVNPPVKAAPISPTVESPVLLLPPAAHPFEMAVEKMPHVEAIAALHQPVAAVEPSIEWLDVDSLLEAIDIPAPAPIDYQAMTSAELRKHCSDRGIKWRSVKQGKHLSKPEMIAALS